MNKQSNTLRGLRILNTRPLEQGVKLTKQIQAAGGHCVSIPVMRIEPCLDKSAIESLKHIRVHQAIFISANAVRFFFEAITSERLIWDQITVSAIGKTTAAELSNRGIDTVQIPSIADSEHLIQLETFQNIKEQTILLVKGEGGRDLIEKNLALRGAQIIPINTYRRVLPTLDQHAIQSLWQEDQIDIILFTSEQAIHNLFILLGEISHAWLCNKPCLVISQRLADVAHNLGIKTVYISDYDGIINSLRKQV